MRDCFYMFATVQRLRADNSILEKHSVLWCILLVTLLTFFVTLLLFFSIGVICIWLWRHRYLRMVCTADFRQNLRFLDLGKRWKSKQNYLQVLYLPRSVHFLCLGRSWRSIWRLFELLHGGTGLQKVTFWVPRDSSERECGTWKHLERLWEWILCFQSVYSCCFGELL